MAVVRHRNELPVPVVAHLHGGKTPPQHDGYPTDLILPAGGWDGGNGGHMGDRGSAHMGMGREHGSTHMGVHQGVKDYRYPLGQPAATLWYHDHRMDFTGPRSTAASRGSTSCTTLRRKPCRCRGGSATSLS